MTVFISLCTLVLSIAAFLGFLRVVRGPYQVDRVLALDFLTIVGLAGVMLYAVATRNPLALDVGLGLALVGFVTAYVYAAFEKEG